MIGPYFAFDQKTWEGKNELGFWMRITFASDEKILLFSLKRFVNYAKHYKQSKHNLIQTGLHF